MGEEFGVSNRNGDSWRFQPKVKEAPSFEGAFLVPATPHIGKAPGVGYFKGQGDRQPERQDIQGHRFTMAVALFYWRLFDDHVSL